MRKTYPEYANLSWFILFVFVVFSGGEVPTGMHDIGIGDESSFNDENGNEIEVGMDANRCV